MKKIQLLSCIIFFLVATLGINGEAYSQCAMCRQSAESNIKGDSKVGTGLNSGILYLLTIPYILGGVGVYIWYKNRKGYNN